MLDHDDRVALVHQPLQYEQQLAHILEVQAGGRLIQDVHGFAGRTALQLGGQLDALGFAAREGGRRLAEPDVAQSHLHERVQIAGDGRVRLEEAGRLLDGHVQHVGHGFAVVFDLQRLAVVAPAVAFLAFHVDVGQEVHLDLQRAVAMAGLAAAALDVEREAARSVAAHLRLGGFGEQRADLIPHAGVGGGVGPRRAADRVLVHMDHLVALVEPLHARMLAGHDACAVELVGQHRVQDGVHQRGLARAGDAGHASEHAQREGYGQVLQVVLSGTHHLELLGLAGLAPGFRHCDAPSAGDVVAGHRTGRLDELGRRPGVDDLAAVLAGAGADIDQPVRLLDGLLIVFDHDQRVAEVTQVVQRFDQAFVVALVQADGRLVEHVHDADQAGADLRGQADALRLAAGKRLGRAGQSQIVEAHVVEEAQAGADLLQHLPRDLRGGSFELQRVDPCKALLGGHVAHIRNRLAAHGDGQHLGAQSPPLAGLARHLAHVRLVVLLHLVGVGLLMAAHQRAHHALESGRILAQTAPAVPV